MYLRYFEKQLWGLLSRGDEKCDYHAGFVTHIMSQGARDSHSLVSTLLFPQITTSNIIC